VPTDDKFVVDPVLGRIALPPGLPAATAIRVDFHYGFSGELGGGEYDRSATIADAQLDGRERRHAQLHRPTRVAEREEPTDRAGPVGQLRAGELGRRVVRQRPDGGAQRRHIGC
jgi:hypothetical protein